MCVHACECVCFEPEETSPGITWNPSTFHQTREQCKCIWTEEENPKPIGTRVAQSTLPGVAKMQFSWRQIFALCASPSKVWRLSRVTSKDTHHGQSLALLREPQFRAKWISNRSCRPLLPGLCSFIPLIPQAWV